MSLLLLACGLDLCAQAPAADAETAAVTHFRLGAAAATARVYHELDLPRIEVIVTNDTKGPIWWRGDGIGCVGFGMSWAPVDEDGREHPEFVSWGVGCTMEKNRPPTAEQLAEWRLDPGATETLTLHPFWSAEHDEEDAAQLTIVPRLVRWVEDQEFTLPRATPPPGTMDFECPQVLFAWDLQRGLRVFVEQDGDASLPHFDPFDETPFLREDPAPVHLGPLTGTARLLPDVNPPVIELTLRNPMPFPVAWTFTPPTTSRAAGFMNDENPQDSSGIGSTLGVFSADAEALLLPGASRTLRISPFDVKAPPAVPTTERWHFVQHSTWPVADAAPAEAWPPAVLHAVWDPRFGLTVNLSHRTDDFEAFEWDDAYLRSAAALQVGDAWMLASTRLGAPGSLTVEIRPVDEVVYWTEWPENEPPLQTFLYRGSDLTTATADPEWVAATDPLPLNEEDLHEWRIQRGDRGWFGMDYDFSDRWSEHLSFRRGVPWPAWEWTCPVRMPQARAPAHSADFAHSNLFVSWDPASGLSLRIGDR